MVGVSSFSELGLNRQRWITTRRSLTYEFVDARRRNNVVRQKTRNADANEPFSWSG